MRLSSCRSFLAPLLLCFPALPNIALAAVTVYGQAGVINQQTLGVGSASGTASSSEPTFSAPAYNTVFLQAPPVPSPAPATSFGVAPQQNAADVPNLAIQQEAGFYGFSIEFSVVNQVGMYTMSDCRYI